MTDSAICNAFCAFSLRVLATEFFVLVAEDSVVAFSAYGESWSAATLAGSFAEGISAVVCTKRRIVLGGADGVIMYSK